jgi:hypothetical protein
MGDIASKLENLSGKVFEDGDEVNWMKEKSVRRHYAAVIFKLLTWDTGADMLGLVALLEKMVDKKEAGARYMYQMQSTSTLKTRRKYLVSWKNK